MSNKSKTILTPVSKDENFFDSFVEGNNSPEVCFETKEYFSNPINCIYCVTKGKPDNEKGIKGCTTHNGENKGNIHHEAEKCIKNPKNIFDISGIDFIKELKKNGMDTGTKKLIYNTCIINFTKNCINCMENRCKEIKINDKYSIKFCWSKIKEGLNTICIGFHSNFKFKISNNKIIKESIMISIFDGYERSKKTIDIPLVEPMEENFNDKRTEFPELGNGKISPTNQLWLDVKNTKVGSVEDEASVKSSRISDVTDNDFSPSFNVKGKKSNDFNGKSEKSEKSENVGVLETPTIIREKTEKKEKEVSSIKNNDLEEIHLLRKENELLKKENKIQKDGLNALKTLMINDTNTEKESIKIQELEEQIQELKELNEKLIFDNNKKDKSIKNLRMTNEQSDNSKKLSEKDKQEIVKDLNNVSSLITNAVLNFKGY